MIGRITHRLNAGSEAEGGKFIRVTKCVCVRDVCVGTLGEQQLNRMTAQLTAWYVYALILHHEAFVVCVRGWSNMLIGWYIDQTTGK